MILNTAGTVEAFLWGEGTSLNATYGVTEKDWVKIGEDLG